MSMLGERMRHPDSSIQAWEDCMDYWDILEPYAEEVEIYGSVPDYLDQLSLLPRDVQNLLALHVFIGEELNGGLAQFFWNSSGIVAPETLAALAALGQVKAKELLHVGMSFFGTTYPRERHVRIDMLRNTYLADQGGRENPFRELDSEFYKFGQYGEEMWTWLDEYATAISRRKS